MSAPAVAGATSPARSAIAWLAIRLTGVVLTVLVLAHFAVTHVLVDVSETDSAFVAARWESGVIAATDWLMLVAAVVHGAAGAWIITNEYAGARSRRIIHAGVAVGACVMIAGGTVTLLAVLAR